MQQRVMTVPVTMPERVWGRLTSVAAERQVTVSDLIADAVEGLVAKRLARDEVPEAARESLALMCEAGMGIEGISSQLHMDSRRVSRWLAQCGLKTAGQVRAAKSRTTRGEAA